MFWTLFSSENSLFIHSWKLNVSEFVLLPHYYCKYYISDVGISSPKLHSALLIHIHFLTVGLYFVTCEGYFTLTYNLFHFFSFNLVKITV